jgi:hypothetical protein
LIEDFNLIVCGAIVRQRAATSNTEGLFQYRAESKPLFNEKKAAESLAILNL